METIERDESPSSAIAGFAGLSTARANEHLLPVRRFGVERMGDKQELVALAISALRQADDATAQAFRATGRARRDRVIFGTIGAVGVAVGLAGVFAGSGGVATTLTDAAPVTVTDSVRPRSDTNRLPVVFADRPLFDAAAPLVAEPAMMPAVYIRPLPLPPGAEPIPAKAPSAPALRHTGFVPHPAPRPAVAAIAAPAPARHGALYRFVHNIFH